MQYVHTVLIGCPVETHCGCETWSDTAQCEKHSKKEEALEKLRNGSKFDEVARDFSEDKVRQGMYLTLYTSRSFCADAS